jgi:hypothetical protein
MLEGRAIMRKIEIIEEEILVTKQALSLYKAKLQEENTLVNMSELEIVDKILENIKDELKNN